MNGEQLTLLPAESLASLSVWPGSREARQMTVTSGRKLLASSRLCGRVGSALRTLVASSTWHSTTCLLTWHHKVTKQGRSYFQLRASVPRTSEPESGHWPTPRSRDSHAEGVDAGIRHKEKWGSQTLATAARVRPEGMRPTPRASEVEMRTYSRTPSQEAGKHGMYLQAEVLHAERMLPTPRAIYGEHPGMTDPRHLTGAAMLPTPRAEGFDAGAHRGKPDSLHSYVKMLPTPTAHDHKDTGAPSEAERNSPGLAHHAGAANAQTGMKLNPAWVSRMMGFPDDYLTLDGEATP